jgi:hypothetical protein
MATTCKLIAKNTLGSNTANIEFTSIPGTYTDLVLVVAARSARAQSVNQSMLIQFNADTGANYSQRRLYGEGGSTGSDTNASTTAILATANGGNSTSNTFASNEVYIPNYAGSTNKSVSVTGVVEANATTTDAGIYCNAGLWSNTAAITSIKIAPSGGFNFVSGSSAYLYGITKS